MKAWKKAVVLVFLSAMLFTAGCVVAAVGAGAAGVAYVKGKATKVYAAPMDECIRGVKESLAALDLKVKSERGDKISYTFVCKSGKDTDVEVNLKSLSSDSTEISVRFGVFGDRKKSARLHEEFSKRIGEKK